MTSWPALFLTAAVAMSPSMASAQPEALDAPTTARGHFERRGEPPAGLRDAVDYLPNDILVKVDRAAMSVALESRLPLLDHHVFRLAWSLPLEYKRHRTRGNLVLKAVLAKDLPTQLFDRPKRGFSVPIGRWPAGPLRDWAEALLDERRLKDQGLVEHWMVRSAWRRHLAGKAGWSYRVWTVLQFQSWHQRTFGLP